MDLVVKEKPRSLRIGTLPLVLMALAFVGYLLYPIFFPPAAKPDSTWTRIQEQGVIRVGIDPSFPPFDRDDGNGRLSGYDIALAQVFAQKWGVRVQYIYTGFDGLYDALTGDQFDLILSALPYNPRKTQDVYYTHAYFDGGPVLVVRGDSTVRVVGDLSGRAVAVELGTGGDTFGRRWQRRLKLDLREFNTADEAIKAVQQGQAAGALVDPISFYDYRKANPAAPLKLIGPPLANELYVIAVRKTSPTLLLQLNAVIDELKRDGRLEALQKEWF